MEDTIKELLEKSFEKLLWKKKGKVNRLTHLKLKYLTAFHQSHGRCVEPYHLEPEEQLHHHLTKQVRKRND